ncbi:hypothetical protein TRFO_32490 [Tritrichomonas foetus]|uniref:Uncharacterized protein n=1 Tax=Tritrichomonas foetus TaxID=1144522 RepID=A0A1J4JNM3_9EUKA|nr:hypothetical protein TRFO_32490 [Tritrichomonas foetus]|eukprot:OHT00721.1 hypothetical protein TRFO_32490 [Tritrichomonas foetus]
MDETIKMDISVNDIYQPDVLTLDDIFKSPHPFNIQNFLNEVEMSNSLSKHDDFDNDLVPNMFSYDFIIKSKPHHTNSNLRSMEIQNDGFDSQSISLNYDALKQDKIDNIAPTQNEKKAGKDNNKNTQFESPYLGISFQKFSRKFTPAVAKSIPNLAPDVFHKLIDEMYMQSQKSPDEFSESNE